MSKLLYHLFLVFLVAFPAVTVLSNGLAVAVEDATEDEMDAGDPEATATTDEEAESKVETEDESAESAGEASEKTESAEEEEGGVTGMRSHPDAEMTILFPNYPDKQLPAGKPINALIGFANKGLRDFTFETIDASFRYPQDFSYSIQNFTGYRYNKMIEQNTEASFEYAFHPHESYGGRPFGLVITATYKDDLGTEYGASIFNETVTFQEIDESFDGETFFMYIFLISLALLVVFGLNYAFASTKGKKTMSKTAPVEMGTQQDDVDYAWLPKETTTDFSKQSPRRSPRQRRVKRSTGSGDE